MTATDNLQSELEALRTGAAIATITDRAFLRITGPDATRWLNGMVTNNIKDLAPGQGNYNFLLNAQGRIQADCTIYREPGEGEPTFLLETDNSQLETVNQTLDRFIIMDDVELTAVSPGEAGLLLIGTRASDFLKFLELPRTEPLRCVAAQTYIRSLQEPVQVITPVHPSTFEIWATKTTIDELHNIALSNGLSPISPETLEALRILSATPKYGTDIRNTDTAKDLPQETAQTHALNFNKGCYLGQEIVERIHSRGQVHRTFTAFLLTGNLPTLPAPLTANDKPAGELTSAMQIGEHIHALGYLRREFATSPLTYPGGTATPKLATG
jgi:folate-binding protein YgfZ